MYFAPFVPLVVWVLLALVPPYRGRAGVVVPLVHLSLSVVLFVVLGAVSEFTAWYLLLRPGVAVSAVRLAVVGLVRARGRRSRSE